jgi:hypothetical protein
MILPTDLAIGCNHARKLSVSGACRRMRVFRFQDSDINESLLEIHIVPVELDDLRHPQASQRTYRVICQQLVVTRRCEQAGLSLLSPFRYFSASPLPPICSCRRNSTASGCPGMAICALLTAPSPHLQQCFTKSLRKPWNFVRRPKSWLSDKLRYNRRPTANRFP